MLIILKTLKSMTTQEVSERITTRESLENLCKDAESTHAHRVGRFSAIIGKVYSARTWSDLEGHGDELELNVEEILKESARVERIKEDCLVDGDSDLATRMEHLSISYDGMEEVIELASRYFDLRKQNQPSAQGE
jgi:hypothetical protein